jgi:hypothetical protein
MATDNTAHAREVVRSIQREVAPLCFYLYAWFIIVTGLAVDKFNRYRMAFLQFVFWLGNIFT